MACWAMVPATASAQPAMRGAEEATRSLEAQRPAMEAYYQCLRDNEKAYARYSLSQQLIVVRDNREAIELSLTRDSAMKAKYKTYDQVVTDLLGQYRASGGTAGNIAQVKPEPTPCPPPSPKPPSRADLASKSAVSASSSVPAVPVGRAPSASAKAEPGSKSNRDARGCLKLASDKAVMACTEKFR